MGKEKEEWWKNLWAALIFFTRIPFWRIYEPPRGCYKAVVEFWPLAGWVTGGLMALTLWVGSMFLPYYIAVIMAITVRILVTGALHEDGLADFFDGFGGGGNNRQRILDIMKDSRIGTYGVLGLVAYEALLFAALFTLPPLYAALTVLAADPYSKMLAGQLIQMMPYARTEQESKAQVVYRRPTFAASLGLAVQGLLPMIPFFWVLGATMRWDIVIFLPCLVMYFLYIKIWRSLRGYTGDCCGAICLLVELSFYLATAYLFFNT